MYLPVHYGILSVRDNYNNNIGYVVSKCYLIRESKKYFPKGGYVCRYDVIFPYTISSGFEIKKTHTPYTSYDYDDLPIGTENIPVIFDKKSKALDFRDSLNQNIVNDKIGVISNVTQEKCDTVRKEFKKYLTKLFILENEIEDLNKDMILEKNINGKRKELK